MSDQSTDQKTGRASKRLPKRPRPLLSLSQLLVLAAIIFGVYIGFDLNRRAQEGALIERSEEGMQQEVSAETTRQIELLLTREYVNSEAYVSAYARDEAGQVLPGEKRIVPLLLNATPLATPVPTPTPDPAYDARPWQAWWRLFTDAPLPTK